MEEVKSISKIAEMSVIKVAKYLDLNTCFETSSDKYGKSVCLKGEERLIAICRQNNSDNYINAISGKELYKKETFNKKGIELLFIRNQINPYSQFHNEFIPSLSIVDVMMFNDKKIIASFLNNYELE